jgi:hypothetical protein
MVRVAGVAGVAPLGRAVRDFEQMFAVPWLAAEAGQGRDRVSGSWRPSQWMNAAVRRFLTARPTLGTRVRLPPGGAETLHAGRERPPGAAA